MYINGTGHMTKMAATPIYGKNLQKSSSELYNSPMIMNLRMEHYVIELYTIYINDGPELTLTFFTTMSIWQNLFLYIELPGPRYQVSTKFTGPLVLWFVVLNRNTFKSIVLITSTF